ncbi:MAG: PAS domain S-box protein, partial [Burkholderiales bacterium]|nr:PAS domain S-box protein [Burkholderiales bacterium]
MPPTQAPAAPLPTAQRLIDSWWRRQSLARQDRFATLAPLLSVLLFLAAIISAFWYLRNEETERESESVKRDTEITQQQIGLHLIQNQEHLIRMARELVPQATSTDAFDQQARAFVRDRPEVTHLTWLDAQRQIKATHWGMLYEASSGADQPQPTLPVAGQGSAAEAAFRAARESRAPVYSHAFPGSTGAAVFQLYIPLSDHNAFAGALVAEYSIESLVRHFVPSDVAQRHMISVLDENKHLLAATITAMPGQASRRSPLFSDAPLTPVLNGLRLRGQGWRTSIGLVNNTLFWMVVALSILTVWMLLGSWRHMRRRSQIQGALVAETNFRRAMENSMPTGMRAMDLEGHITYVNAAFCQMTGFASQEMVGILPPYPYWPPDRIEENSRLLQQELQGRSPSGGIEVKVMRKDGTLFDARMYVSPLIDPRGQQTGWMTSVTNITEAKRIRDQLSASHERFTTVLEGLDASVSVLSVQQGELLFANRSYRLWFGGDAGGHQLMAGSAVGATAAAGSTDHLDEVDGLSGLPTQDLTEAGTHPREVYVEALQKWFDVRSRYL